jgi:hypothetical protein
MNILEQFLPRRLAAARDIEMERKALKYEKAVLARLEAVQRYVKKHRVEHIRFERASDTVTRFTKDLKAVIRLASEMVYRSEDTVRHLESERANGVRPLSRGERKICRNLAKKMEQRMKQAERKKKRREAKRKV